MYPKSFNNLITMFQRLPGVGEKSAQRYAFNLLDASEEDISEIINSLKNIHEIKRCSICGFLTDSDRCLFCIDSERKKDTIMVVAYPQDAVVIEKTGSYKGLYHILNGLISSSKGIFPEDINIENLLNRLDDNTREIILAISPTVDGEMTALYIDKILKDKNVLVTRLAHGLPMGASLDYADELTLIKAMNNRRKINDE